MTILFLTRLFFPHIGGVEKHVSEVARILTKRGHIVTVITEELSGQKLQNYRSQKGSAKSADGVGRITIVRIPKHRDGWSKKFFIWKWLWLHRAYIQSADIVHCHDVFFWFLPFRFLFPRKPVYTTFHGYEARFPPTKRATLVRKLSEKLSWGNICIGDYIVKWYGTRPTYMTYGGVNKVKSSKLKVQSYNSKLKILFIGRLEIDTGLPIYLEVLKMLIKKGIQFSFVACGDGSLRRHAEQFGRVYGFVQDISPYLNSAIVVFASSYLAILEAIVARRPVFAVYTNALKEDYLRMSPFAQFITFEADPTSLANKLEELTKNPHEKNLVVQKAHDWAVQHPWDDVVDLYRKLWKI